LSRYLSETEIQQFQNGESGITSITVFATKTADKRELIGVKSEGNCAPGSGCC